MTATSALTLAAWASTTSGGASSCGDPQGGGDLAGPPREVPLPPATAQGRDDAGLRQATPPRRVGRDGEDGEGIGMAELGECGQGTRVVLAQGAAQRVRLALPRPDEALVGPREDLYGAEQLAVGGHRTVVVPVGPDEVGEDAGVTPVGLGPARRVALAVARGRQRVHGMDRVAGRHQGAHEQAPVGLDADDDLLGAFGVLRQQRVQPGHPFEALGDPSCRQDLPLGVEDADVMVRLGPVDAHEDHRPIPPAPRCGAVRGGRGELMDQCSAARHPSSHLDHPRRPSGARSSHGTREGPAAHSAHPMTRLIDQSDSVGWSAAISRASRCL